MEKPTADEWKYFIDLMEKNTYKPILIGEQFGEYFYEHFLNCLPPLSFSNDYVICSEPNDETKYGATYVCIYKNHNTWFGLITDVRSIHSILNSRKDWNNPDRTRYYGLCIGDNVQVNIGIKTLNGIVNSFGFTDNNRVSLQFPDGSLSTWVAEHCKLVEKYNEKSEFNKYFEGELNQTLRQYIE